MVRVFSAYHYRGQSIHSISEDISASCLMDNDHIILAKSNHVIEIRSIRQQEQHIVNKENGSPCDPTVNTPDDLNHNSPDGEQAAGQESASMSLSFPTVDQVLSVVHCKQGNYILTMEASKGRRQQQPAKVHCRVYTNWWSVDPISGCYNTSIRARIADKTTPSTTGHCLEVIELLTRDTPRQIAVCQVTGNIVVATDAAGLLFYQFQSCVSDSSKHPYIDFKELPFGVDLDFVADHVAMTEHCIAAGNGEFTVVFRVTEALDGAGASHSDDALSATSLTTSDSISGADESNGRRREKQNRTAATGIDLELCQLEDWDVRLTSTMDGKMPDLRKSSLSEYRPIHIDMDCHLRQLSATGGLFTLKPLLRIRQRDIRDPFKCMSLKPIYMEHRKTDEPDTDVKNNPLKSVPTKLMGIVILVATANDGYVYQFSNNDKWVTEDGHFIATYPFTSPVIEVQLHDYVLHALTDRGIETYTLRTGHKVFSSCFEYDLRDATDPIEACPRLEDPICLIGLRPFLGVRRLHCTDKTLVLMATVTGDAVWTIYSLRLPKPEDLYADFIALAEQHRTDSPGTYVHLLNEAHMIVRTAVEFLQIQRNGEAAILRAYDSNECMTVYTESCRRLADFCVISTSREEYCQAFPYYTMGGVGICEVHDRVLEQRKEETSIVGLIHTLKNMFIKLRHGHEDIARILTGIRASGQSFGDELLQLFLAEAPHEIAVLSLRSQCFRDLMSSKVCAAIQTKQDRTDEDRMCLILDAVRNSDSDRARNLLAEACRDGKLFNVLTQYWCVLFDTAHIKRTGRRMTTFSELTESYLLAGDEAELQRCTANVFVHLTVDTRVLTVDLMIKLLMDHLASRVCQTGYATGQLVLQTLLEAYLYDLYVKRRFHERADRATVPDDPATAAIESMVTTSSSSEEEPSSVSSSSECSAPFRQRSARTISSAADSSFPIDHYYGHLVHSEAMKILCRIYLGKLKKFQFDGADERLTTTARAPFFKFMRLNLGKLYEHHQTYAVTAGDTGGEEDEDCEETERRVAGNLALEKRPILYLAARPAYLNDMHPFEGKVFGSNGASWNWNDIQMTVVKFQSILSSGRLTRDVLQEIIYFFEANSPILGIDSYISLLLPAAQCTYFFIEHQSHHLAAYVQNRFSEERQWSEFLIQLLEHKSTIVKKTSTVFFEDLLKGILQYLIGNKRLTQIIKIFPIKNVETGGLVTAPAGDADDSASSNMHNEEMLFTKFLTEAIDRDRAERLGEMIKTTGYQLYETYNRNKQFFN